RLLVAISPSPLSESMARWTRRLADNVQAPGWWSMLKAESRRIQFRPAAMDRALCRFPRVSDGCRRISFIHRAQSNHAGGVVERTTLEFFFLPPTYTFYIKSFQDALMFGIFFV